MNQNTKYDNVWEKYNNVSTNIYQIIEMCEKTRYMHIFVQTKVFITYKYLYKKKL